jgi:hypothetical protein
MRRKGKVPVAQVVALAGADLQPGSHVYDNFILQRIVCGISGNVP